MCGARSNRLIIALFTGLLVVIPAASAAEQWQQSSAVDGVFVHLGIMPANVIRDHPEYYPEYHAQGTLKPGKISYHVVVAVFDAQSGERIVDADVSAIMYFTNTPKLPTQRKHGSASHAANHHRSSCRSP